MKFLLLSGRMNDSLRLSSLCHQTPRSRPERGKIAARRTRSGLRLIILYYVNLGRCKCLIFLQKKQVVFAASKPA